MDLKTALETAWLSQSPPPQTSLEALHRLQHTIQLAVQSNTNDQVVQTQSRLEDSLVLTLVCFKQFGLDVERAFERAISRAKPSKSDSQCFYLYPDRVEIVVAGDYRGGWPVFTQEDIDSVYKVAQDLNCEVVIRNEEISQLDFFTRQQGASTGPNASAVNTLEEGVA
jgi:hypothetical protein